MKIMLVTVPNPRGVKDWDFHEARILNDAGETIVVASDGGYFGRPSSMRNAVQTVLCNLKDLVAEVEGQFRLMGFIDEV